MQPFKPYFRGDETPPAQPPHLVPEVLPHPRHRRGGEHTPPPHLLRDARQLELRRLLQGASRSPGASSSRSTSSGSTRSASGRPCSAATRSSAWARTRSRSRSGRRTGSPRSGSSSCRAPRTSGRRGRPGPCGPCSEMYFDRGDGVRRARRAARRRHRPLPRVLEPRLHELRAARGRLADASCRRTTSTPAWASSGWRRSSQGVESVFETDAFRPLIDLAEEMSGRSYGDDRATTRAMRIIADHSRGMTFLIADGVVPSNEERGYVLRRVMRRAIQQGRVLGLESPWLGPIRRADDRDDGRRLSRARRSSARRSCAGSATRRRRSGARSTAGTQLLDAAGRRGEGAGHLVDRRGRTPSSSTTPTAFPTT